MKMLLGNPARLFVGTLRRQIIVSVAVVHAVMMALFVWDLTKRQDALLLDRQTEQALALSRALAVSAAGWLAADDISGLQEIVNAQSDYPELTFAMLVDHDGKILAHTQPDRVGSYLQDLPVAASQTTLHRSRALVDVISPAELGGRPVGWARVGISQKVTGEIQAALVRDGLVYALAAILIGSGLAWLTGRRFTRRLYVVQKTINSVRGGNRQARAEVRGSDEVADIADEFNVMLDALAESDAGRQRLHRQNQLILQAAGEGIYGVDIEGRILFANPAAIQMLGYPLADLLGKNSHQLFHHTRADGSPNPEAECPLQKSLHEGAVYRGQDEVFWAKDGRMFPTEHVNTPILEEGRVVGAVVVFRDISERRRDEERLRLANMVIEKSPSVLFRWRAAADWPVEYVSENVSQFGYAAADLLSGKVPFAALIYPEDLARVAEEVERYSASGVTSFAQEYRLVTAAGEVRTIDDRTTVERDGEGRVSHYQGVVIDISERKRLEGQLRQAQKMEAIGTLAGGIAHDFNNILTAVIGFGEIVMEQLPPDSPLREDQDQVLKAGARARDLVKQILTFSRRSEQQAQPLLIQFVAKEALKLIRAAIPTSIEIREDIDVNCGMVLADPVQIHQVVMNLCTNAYQAMRETGGVLTVSLRCLTMSAEDAKMTANLRAGPHVCLEVADTGCGMSRAVQERIFEPYFTTKAKGEGTGLGLPLVHGIVTGLGGGINVYSEPGLGTTVKVYLPLVAGEKGSEPEAAREAAPGGVESILVADDEEVIARLERKLLEGLGYRVTFFADSEQALRAFRADPHGFDLLLTDMTMPGLNGDELAREVLRIRPEMPIILCTGFSDLIDAEKAKAMRVREFLLKPLNKSELAKALRRALDVPKEGKG